MPKCLCMGEKVIKEYQENILFLSFTIFGIILLIANSTILAKCFSIEDFGYYQLLLTFIGVLSIFNLTGYDVYIQKKVLREEIAYFYYVLKNIMPLSLIGICFVFCISYIINYEHFKIFGLAVLLVSFSIFDKLFSLLEIKKEFKLIRYLDLSNKVVFLVLSICVMYFQINLENFLYLFVGIYITIISSKILYSFYLIKFNYLPIDNSDIKNFNNDAMKRTWSISFAVLANWIERLVLGALSPTMLAIFSIAYLIPKMIKDNIKSVLKPTIFQWVNLSNQEFLQKINTNKYKLLLMGFVVYIITIIVVSPFIGIFYPKYMDSINLSQILSIPLIFIFVAYVFASYIIYSQHTHESNKIENISNVLKIVCAVSLIPLYNLEGAVISAVVPELIRQYMYYNVFKRVTHEHCI